MEEKPRSECRQNKHEETTVGDGDGGCPRVGTVGTDPAPGPDRASLRLDRCHFYLEKKRRYCRTIPNSGSSYCVEHSHFSKTGVQRKRIPCPLDPKHTCYEDQLKKHIKKCNAREGEKLDYFSKNINSGLVEEKQGEENEKVSITNINPEEIVEMVHKAKKIYADNVPKLQEEILFHDALREETDKSTNGPAAQKHLQQQASLVGHMQKAGLLVDDRCYIEFGAGKGGLSHWVQRALAGKDNTQFILVERGGVRYKKDAYHKGEQQGPVFERLRIDIQHLHLAKVKSMQDSKKPIIGIGKHLCGGATDLMLRCLMETAATSSNETDIGPVEGVVLALCCHHRCDWNTYVGKEFFTDLGLRARDFHLFTSMTSWATCATRSFLKKLNGQRDVDSGETLTDHEVPHHNEEDYNHPRYGKMTPEEREEVGYMCKKIIDMGRVHYLRKHSCDGDLVCYTDKAFSLENVALVAKKRAEER